MKVSFKEKYSYGIGALGKDMVCGLIFTFSMLYFTDVLKISAAFVGTLFFLAKFWDAINDLGMGIIVDNTRTKWGKFRPWLLIGTLINAVVFVCLFTNWNLSGTKLYVFASIMYILWGMTYTIMDIPYWSMLPNITQDKEEREKISVIPRVFASIGGSLLIGGFGLQIIEFLGKGNDSLGFERFAFIIAIIFVITISITVINVKSADNITNKSKEKTSLKQMIKIITKNDQLLVAIGLILTYNFAMQVISGISTYYFIYVVGSKSMFSIFTMFAGFAEIAGLIMFPKIVNKIERKKVYLLASMIPVIGLLTLFVIGFIAPESSILTAFSGICIKFGSGLQLGIVTVILADVVDYGEYKFGTRNESITFSIQTLLVKLTSAMGALLSGFALTSTGYVPNEVQTTATLNGMRFVMIGIPMIFVIISFIVYTKYFKLTDDYYEKIISVLEIKRKNKLKEENEIFNENLNPKIV